jgi:hypothetical protein
MSKNESDQWPQMVIDEVEAFYGNVMTKDSFVWFETMVGWLCIEAEY